MCIGRLWYRSLEGYLILGTRRECWDTFYGSRLNHGRKGLPNGKERKRSSLE
jgi:hypothetical protein